MRSFLSLLLFFWIPPLLLVACDSTTPSLPAESAVAPFSDGQVLQYRYTVVEEPIGEPGTDTLRTQDVVVEVASLEASLDTLDRNLAGVSLTDLVEVHAYDASDPQQRETVWYAQSPDSLVEVAYRNAGALPVVTAGTTGRQSSVGGWLGLPQLVQARLAAPARAQRSSASDIRLRDDPRVVYRAPLEPGLSWTSFRDPFVQTRTVVGAERTTTPAGTFDTVVIETTSSTFNDLRWRDRVAPEGLVERIVQDTITVRGPNNQPEGPAVLTETLRLTGVSSTP
jgi:hypothetical protein